MGGGALAVVDLSVLKDGTYRMPLD